MPELPEVETIRQDLNRLIVGKKILGIETDSPKQVKPSLQVVKKAVVGKRILGVERRAKLLILRLDAQETRRVGRVKPDGFNLLIHLKLTGRLLVREKSDPPDDWQRVTVSLSEGKELRFCDLRKFGWIKLVSDKKELESLLSEFGPEPLDSLNLKTFKKILASTSRPIKIVLMDQEKIAGVGNIYASEALFLGKIDPRRPANKVSSQEIKKLYQAMEKVLKAGIKYRGASDQYYLDALGQKGSYQDHFLVYQREGKKCFKCGGKIKRIKLGGRGTFFCPRCQK